MPLLPQEAFVNPPDLLTQPLPDSEGRWWVLHTRPRAEKSVARRAAQHGLAFFLPLYRKTWKNEGRRFSSFNPLFPGYVFLHGDADARSVVQHTNLVACALPVVDQSQLHVQLGRVFGLMNTGAALTPEERLAPGDTVRIARGPFEGYLGRVLQRGKQMRLVVEVQFLRQGVSVEIESWMVVPERATARPELAAV